MKKGKYYIDKRVDTLYVPKQKGEEKYMKFAKNKTAAIAIAIFLMLSMSASILLPTVSSAETYNTYAFLSVTPNPVGVSQTLTSVMWLDKPTPTASGSLGDHWQNYILTITKPDGTNTTLGPYQADASATATARYVPDSAGQYYFQFSFPGQWINTTTYYRWYKPSVSPIVNITVQQEPLQWWPQAPLPTDYWTRPIEGENTLWSSISGNWLQDSYSPIDRFNPYTTVPNTAHIVWTKETGIGGLIGGEFNASIYYTGQYEASFRPPVIINGLLYYNDWMSTPGGTGLYPYPPGFVCVDLRTGETLWRNNETTNGIGQQITYGQVYMEESPTEYGGWPYLWQTGTTYKMYDAYTGIHWLDLVNATAPGKVMYDTHGDMLVYILNGANKWLAMWNSTLALTTAAPGSYAATQWRPVYGSVLDWRKGVQWNVTIPNVGMSQSIVDIGSDIIIANTQGLSTVQSGGYVTYAAYSLKPGQEGQQLWVENVTVDAGSTGAQTAGPMTDGVFVRFAKETMQWYGYDAYTGKQLWGPTAPYDDAYGMYGGGGIGAYGNFYTMAYDGKVRAYDINNGTLLWTYYSGSSGFATPYGEWPFYQSPNGFTVADGKVIAPTSEHQLDEPTWMGWKLYVINATTGQLVWNILGLMANPVVADGYLLTLNAYDCRIYCFGKGQTATTVSAPLTGVTAGQSVTIMGTVTDQSPGATGTPAIADASMTQWMEYEYMQKPIPTNATGVPVSIDAVDPNGNYIHIGNATSDTSGLYSYEWTPPNVPGEYTIRTTFGGTESYYSSYSETAMSVTEPSATASPYPVVTLPPTEMYIGVAAAAIIVVILIVGALTMLMLRKRP